MLKDQIQELLDQGYSKTEAAKILGITRFKLHYHISEKFRNYIKDHVNKNREVCANSRDKLNDKIYHFQYDQKITKQRIISSRYRQPLTNKIYSFTKRTSKINMENNDMFTKEDLLNKIGPEPTCYLTGDQIDLTKPRSYELDHIIPVSRGGTNNLDNAGLCTKEANRAKQNMTPDEFINLCKKVLEYNGYQVNKI